MAKKKAPRKKTASPAKTQAAAGKLTRRERDALNKLHSQLRPVALEMRQDEIDEVSGEVSHRWKWGRTVHDAMDEKVYGEGQVELMAEFLGKRPEALWEVRKFYRCYPDQAQLSALLKIQREDGRPLSWSVICEVLRREFTDKQRVSWLQRAAKGNWDYRTLRAAILAKLSPKDDGADRGVTPKRALSTAAKQAEKFDDKAAEFDETLEEKLIKGNAEDFTDDVMAQLETTREALLEMRNSIDTHLQLVDRCRERGQELRGIVAQTPSADTETAVAQTTSPPKRAVKKKAAAKTSEPTRRVSKRKRPVNPVSTTSDDDMPEAAVAAPVPRPSKRRPVPGNPLDKISQAKQRARKRRPAVPAS